MDREILEMNQQGNLFRMYIIHFIIYVFLLSMIMFLYWLIYRDTNPEKETPDKIASVIQNAISTGLIAVSIVLPLTTGMMAFSVKEKIACIHFLFCACVFFFFSLIAALLNMFRLQGLVTRMNVANDFQTAVFQIIQLYSLLYGFLYLLIGAFTIIKSYNTIK